MRALVTLIPVLLILVSCSGKSPSKASFEINLQGLPAASAYGGLVIFGTDGKNSFTRIVSNAVGSASGTVTEELAKGSTWNFSAVAWLGAEAFTGEIRCAFTKVVVPDADSLAVNLTLTNLKCFDSSVANANTASFATPKAFKTLTASFCEGNVSTRTNLICDYNATIRPIEKGFAGSYQFVVKGTSGKILQSKCYQADTNAEPVAASYNTSTLNIPAFLPSVGSPIQIESYLSQDCDPGKGVLVRSLSDPALAKISNLDGTFNFLHVSTPSVSLCAISDLKNTISSPASGQGTLGSPFLICNERQLFSIQSNYNSVFGTQNVKDAVYVLGRDMNLLSLINGVTGSTPPSPCIEVGDTFLPIGMDFDGSCNASLATTGANTFAFDGNGKTIHHLRMKRSNEDYMAMFSQLNGNIYDVNFKQADIEGNDYTAVAVGYKSGGTVKMIKVEDSHARGHDFVGSVLGFSNGALNMYKIFVKGADVEGRNETGGIVGHLNTGSFSEGSFSGSIYAESGAFFVGGIVGKSFIPLNQMVSTGVVRGSATDMGGIAGFGGTISYSRSDMFIKDYDSSTSGTRNFGGLIGSPGATITKSVFFGTIDTSCTGACAVGGLAGSGTQTDSYSTFNSALGGLNGDTSTYNVDQVYLPVGPNLATNMCNGVGGCPWTQTLGDIPRLNTFEASGPELSDCSLNINRQSLALQRTMNGNRGTSAEPLILCRPNQLLEMDTYPGFYFKMKANINLSLFTSGTLTDFRGHLNGENHFLHTFKVANYNSQSALFTDIISGASVKNVQLAGFSLSETSCTGCVIAPLSIANNGIISNVAVTDARIDIPGVNNFTGGIVAYNFGTMDNVSVDGDIASEKNIGGIAYQNMGIISNSVSNANIDGMISSDPSTGFFGGVVADNFGTIQKTRFEGEIFDIPDAQFVGGIAAYLNTGSILRNNEFNHEGEIAGGVNTEAAGGIAGFADVSTVILERNLSNGAFYFPASPVAGTIKSLVGDGTFVNTYSLKLTTPQVMIEAGTASFVSYNATTLVCTLNLTRTGGNAGSTVFGMIYLNNDFYFGTLVDNTSTYDFTTTAKDSSKCAAGVASIYQTLLGVPDTLNITTLKSPGGWDIADMSVTADKNRVLTAYTDTLYGKTPASVPVWIYEADEEGLKLFRFD